MSRLLSRPSAPLSQFVLKVQSRCDLACDHCYVYQAADQSWRSRPLTMSDETIRWTALRIAEHVKTHQLVGVQVILHGGEPLLAGRRRLKNVVEALRVALDGLCDLDLRVHSNGVLLSDGFLDLFASFDVKVGISIDGDRAANDRHRRYADGRSSHEQVVRAIERLRADRYRHLYAGLLCTIDVLNDPVAVYKTLLSLEPPQVDFLLPHATWDAPPPRPNGAVTAYADWLIMIFDRWLADGRPVGIRMFDSIIKVAHGGNSLTEALGFGPSDLVVIETDGSYEQVDSLKVAFEGAPFTGYDIFSHALDIVSRHPGISARRSGLDGLCDTCRSCHVVATCGGGLYSHRYRSGTGFHNPSVYCADLIKLINHVSKGIRQADKTRERKALALRTHTISDEDFREVAAGYGKAAAIGGLTAAQRSLSRSLITAVYQIAAASEARHAGVTGLRAAWDLLSSIDQSDPEVVSDVLSHPYVRVWAVHCLERLHGEPNDRAAGAVPLVTDLGHLAATAAAAAVRSGASAQIALPVRQGAMYLPTLGMLVLGHGRRPRHTPNLHGSLEWALMTIDTVRNLVTVQTADADLSLSNAELVGGSLAGSENPTVDSNAAYARWLPRRLTAPGISVMLEDTDPYRDCHQWSASPRLSGAQHAMWQERFSNAWAQIQREHAAYAPGIAAGLRTIMPLAPSPSGKEISATSRHAFGAVAVALPADATTLALLLIHEFQHVKLGAMLDLYDLFDRADTRLFDAPWREDPRPLEGLLQGTYAHVAVTDFWRARWNSATSRVGNTGSVPATSDVAAERFAHWRTHTAQAIDTLATSGSLTPLGGRFVAEMRASVTPWLAEPAPVQAARE